MTDQHRILEKCRQLDSEGKIEASISLLTDSISHSPDAVLYFERGWRLEEIGQNDLAKGDYARAIQLKPISKYFIAKYLLSSSRFSGHESGLHDFQQALTVDIQNPIVFTNLALCNLLLGRLSDAIENAGLAVELAPENDVAHSCLGQCLLAAGRPNDAAEELQIATSLDPASANSRSLLSRALRNTAKLGEAKVCIERAIELDRSAMHLISYASLLLELKEPLPAITVLREVHRMNLTEGEGYLVEDYLEMGKRMLEIQ